MTPLPENTIRSYVDHELPETEHAEAVSHLASCPDCRTRLEAASGRAGRVSAHLAALAPAPSEAPRPAQAALAQMKDKQRKENASMLKSIFSRRYRPAWIGLAVVASLAFALTLPPVQVWAANFLGLFRVQRIEVVEIDTTRLSEINGDATLGERIGELFSDSFKVTKEAGEPQAVASVDEASQLAGFTVRLPGNQSNAPKLTVQDSTAFEFTIDRARAQAILSEAGYTDLQLPESLDGAPISVSIPASVTAAYGGCPEPDMTEAERENMSWDELNTCVILAQIPSPTVNAPPGLDVARLAEIGLQFIGMEPEEAQKLSETVDWSTTLVVPIPRNAASVTEVSVDGVTGTLLRRYPDDGVPDRYTLLWVKDGIISALSGFGYASAPTEIANSMK
ncbi:MAG: zf-HC2 domain-containing protein [Chloroflexota bacterium]